MAGELGACCECYSVKVLREYVVIPEDNASDREWLRKRWGDSYVAKSGYVLVGEKGEGEQ